MLGILSVTLWLGGLARADEPVATVADLRALEGKVKMVTEMAVPATVSLYSEKAGSSGSGVIVSREGVILTAAHVVDGAETMTVIFPDGKQAEARVLGANRSKDAAMVRLVGEGPWPYVEMGESKELKVGQFVVSLGHAGGYDPVRTPPVRFGRVVAINPIGFVATDCTLIGGDSGGPLFDLEGRVVGIHSSIGASLMANNHTGVSGFKSDWERLEKGDTWGRLTMNPLMNPDRPVMGFNVEGAVDGGVRISEIFPDSPAQAAGLRRGDILQAINGKPVRSLRMLQGFLAEREPGEEVEIEFTRNGRERFKRLKLARLADVLGDEEG